MKIRKYYARTMREGLQQIKEELGPEAIILHSRKVRRRGFRGFFMPRQLEIMAAVEDDTTPASTPDSTFETDHVMQELTQLKSLVHRLVLKGEESAEEGENEHVLYWKRHLEQHDLAPELLEDIFEEIRLKLQGEVQLTREIMALILQKMVAKRVRICQEKPSRLQVFIGPTGVGKTTTLAKLAAHYSIYQREKVGLITVDHYRIGAVEQLRTYAEIVDLPLEVVMSPRDVGPALRRLEQCERILVDTAGRGTGNIVQINELGSYISHLKPADILLTISATTRWQDIKYIAESFKKLDYNRLVLTKLDETKCFGAVLNAVYASEAPLTYLTDGQNVPDDLKFPSEVDVPSLLIGVKD